MRKHIHKYIDIDVDETFNVGVKLTLDNIKDFFDECNDSEKQELRSALKLTGFASQGNTVIDSMKHELIREYFDKYSIEEWEARLK